MARKTYRTKKAALAAANGREIYSVMGPPRGWRISRGAKVRGARGRARKRNIAKRKKKKVKSNLGKVYRLKKWAVRFAKGRPVRKVKGGWKIYSKKKGNPNPAICGFDWGRISVMAWTSPGAAAAGSRLPAG